MHSNQHDSIWTPALKSQLFSLLHSGCTFKEIAQKLNLKIGQVAGFINRTEARSTTLSRLSELELNFEKVKKETELPKERKFLQRPMGAEELGF